MRKTFTSSLKIELPTEVLRSHELSDKSAWQRALRPKQCKFAGHQELVEIVSKKLKRRWLPQQKARWLKRHYPPEPEKRVSHETIYRSLYIQATAVLKKELLVLLRSKRVIRRSKHASLKRVGKGQIPNAVTISERLASVEDQTISEHWEGNLIGGSNNNYFATLVERQSRYVMLAKVKNKDTESVINALIKQSRDIPTELYQSLTWDRSNELADHQRFSLATNIHVYCCDPYCPWQRGLNENTNRLLREYFPKQQICQYTHNPSLMQWLANQMNDQERPLIMKHRLSGLTHVLQRPIVLTAKLRQLVVNIMILWLHVDGQKSAWSNR